MELYTVFRPLLWTEKQDNQRPADKIEPKFKVGDWVVTSYGKVNQVIAIDEDGDGFTLDDDTYFSGSWKDSYHLWTIQDAKDGDVLISQYGNPLIYNGNYNSLYIGAYCGITCDDNKFKVAEEKCHWTENVDIKPATKEQHDLLFTKMKEANYRWDAEKKELKKIHVIDEGKAEMDYCFTKMMAGEKANPAWNVEDSSKVQRICKYLDEAKKYYADITEVRECVNWLKSLKDRVQPNNLTVTDEELAQVKKDAYNDALNKIEYHSGEPTFDDGWSAAIWYLKKRNIQPQPKQEWSEEDEKMFRSLSNALARISSNTRTDSTSINYSFFAEIDWLKSLKDRVQPQHKEWSDEDKEMFKLCVDAIENYYTEEDENRIYKWLKSLKN